MGRMRKKTQTMLFKNKNLKLWRNDFTKREYYSCNLYVLHLCIAVFNLFYIWVSEVSIYKVHRSTINQYNSVIKNKGKVPGQNRNYPG